MAVDKTIIEAVRVLGADGIGVEYQWKPNAWYLVRDDCPYVDILIKGYPALAKDKVKLQVLADLAPAGTTWQRWDFEADIATKRRLGEINLPLKVPKDCTLRCYVIPALLLSYRDVIAMVEDIESELEVDAAWDTISERAERSWSRRRDGGQATTPSELVGLVEDELRSASSVRRDPFTELGPQSRRGFPLAENAIVSHWASRRRRQLLDSADVVATTLKSLRSKGARTNPGGRQKKIEDEIVRLTAFERRVADLTGILAHLVEELELMTSLFPSPLFQRDHRLRRLLRAFAPRLSEVLSEMESLRSHYPPVFLNNLWQLWGAVWLAKQFRQLGFMGACSTDAADGMTSYSWRFHREDVVLELDYEPDPVLIDYERLPAVHDRDVPALEWAARNQAFDVDRPFFGSEPVCSPDYIIRITTPNGRYLMVGDACLASPKHHGKSPDRKDAKPYTVERYRRTLGWAIEGQVVRCHPMGGFVVFPPPSIAWRDFQQLPGASDCTLLCPSPQEDHPEASRRLASLLIVVAPELGK